MTLFNVVRHGSMVGFWNAMPTIFSGPVTARPATVTLPPLGGSRPVISFIKEDLPQPEGPTTATNSPRAKLMLASERASTPPTPHSEG